MDDPFVFLESLRDTFDAGTLRPDRMPIGNSKQTAVSHDRSTFETVRNSVVDAMLSCTLACFFDGCKPDGFFFRTVFVECANLVFPFFFEVMHITPFLFLGTRPRTKFAEFFCVRNSLFFRRASDFIRTLGKQ